MSTNDLSVHIPDRSLPPLVLNSVRAEEGGSSGPSTAEIYGANSARPHGNRPHATRRGGGRTARDREQQLHNEALPSRVERAWAGPRRFGESSGSGSGVATPTSTLRQASPPLHGASQTATRSSSPARPLPPTSSRPSIFRGRMGNILSHIIEFGVPEDQFVEYLDTLKDEHRQKWLQKLGRMLAKVGSLFDATRFLSQGISKPAQHVVDVINVAKSIIGCEIIVVYKVNDSREDLSLFCSTQTVGKDKERGGKDEGVLPKRIPIGQGFAGSVAEQGKALNLSNAYRDSRFSLHTEGTSNIYDVKSIISVPIRNSSSGVVPGQVVGVIEAINGTSGRFSKIEEVLLERAGIAIGSLRVFKTGVLPADQPPPVLDAQGASHGAAYAYVNPSLDDAGSHSRISPVNQASILRSPFATTSGSNNSGDSPMAAASARGRDREKEKESALPHSAVETASQHPKPPTKLPSASGFSRPHAVGGRDKAGSGGGSGGEGPSSTVNSTVAREREKKMAGVRGRKRHASAIDTGLNPAGRVNSSPTEGISPRYDAERAHLVVNKYEKEVTRIREEGKRLQAIASGKLPIATADEVLQQLSALKLEVETLRHENTVLKTRKEDDIKAKVPALGKLSRQASSLDSDSAKETHFFQLEESDMGPRLSLRSHIGSSSEGQRPFSAEVGKVLLISEPGKGGITGAAATDTLDSLRGDEGVIFSSSKVALIPDVARCSHYDEAYDGGQTRSMCIATVKSKTGLRIGVIRMVARAEGAFGPRDVRHVESLSLMLASVMMGNILNPQPVPKRPDSRKRPHPHPPNSPSGEKEGGGGSRRGSFSSAASTIAERKVHTLQFISHAAVTTTGSERLKKILVGLMPIFKCSAISVFTRSPDSEEGREGGAYVHKLSFTKRGSGEVDMCSKVAPAYLKAVSREATACERQMLDGSTSVSFMPRPPFARPPSAPTSRPSSREKGGGHGSKGTAIFDVEKEAMEVEAHEGEGSNEGETASESEQVGENVSSLLSMVPGRGKSAIGCIVFARQKGASFGEIEASLAADCCLSLSPLLFDTPAPLPFEQDLSLSQRLQEAMHSVSKVMEASSTSSDKAILKSVEREVMKIARGSRCSLFFFHEDSDSIFSPSIPTEEGEGVWCGSLADTPLIQSAVRSQQIQVLSPEDVASLKAAGEAGVDGEETDDEGVFCVLTAPILGDSLAAQANGAVQVERTSQEVGVFSESDKTVLSTFCSAIAPVLSKLSVWATSSNSMRESDTETE